MLKKILGVTTLAVLMGTFSSFSAKAVEVTDDYQVDDQYIMIQGMNSKGIVERFYIDRNTFQLMQTIEKAPHDPDMDYRGPVTDRGPIPLWFKKHGLDTTAVYSGSHREDVFYLNHYGQKVYHRKVSE